MKKPIYLNLKIKFFRYIWMQSSSSQGDHYSLENGHGNLALFTMTAIVKKMIFEEIMHFAR